MSRIARAECKRRVCVRKRQGAGLRQLEILVRQGARQIFSYEREREYITRGG